MTQRWRGYNNPAKTFLSRYRALSVQLDSIQREVIRKRQSLTSITAPIKEDVIKTSGAGDRMANAIAQIIDSETQFAEIVSQIVQAQTEVMDAIESVPDDTQKAVLMLRYIEGLDWISVQEKVGYERTQIYVIHGRALVEINRWLERRIENEENGKA